MFFQKGRRGDLRKKGCGAGLSFLFVSDSENTSPKLFWILNS
jgi:hypothetical protein